MTINNCCAVPICSITEKDCVDLDIPTEFVLHLIGSKGCVPILGQLFRGDRRTHELIEALPTLSTKTLTARLRELEKYGIIKRTIYPEIPPHVEYSLTNKGRELKPLIEEIRELGVRWLNGGENNEDLSGTFN